MSDSLGLVMRTFFNETTDYLETIAEEIEDLDPDDDDYEQMAAEHAYLKAQLAITQHYLGIEDGSITSADYFKYPTID